MSRLTHLPDGVIVDIGRMRREKSEQLPLKRKRTTPAADAAVKVEPVGRRLYVAAQRRITDAARAGAGPTNHKVKWEWCADALGLTEYTRYEPAAARQLEQAWASSETWTGMHGPAVRIDVDSSDSAHGGQYRVDLNAMVQVNEVSDYRRLVRRTVLRRRPLWRWASSASGDSTFVPYGEEESWAIEAARLLLPLGLPHLELEIGGSNYRFDLAARTQTKVDTGFERAIQCG